MPAIKRKKSGPVKDFGEIGTAEPDASMDATAEGPATDATDGSKAPHFSSDLLNPEILSEALYESIPTGPKPGDLPGFRRALNKMLAEKAVDSIHFATVEESFRREYENRWVAQRGLNTEVEIRLLRDFTYAPQIGQLDLMPRYPKGLKSGDQIRVPLFAAQHLVERGAAIILRAH